MIKTKKTKKYIPPDFDKILAKELGDEKFKQGFDECGQQLALAYSIMQLRQSKKISQKSLAEKIGTTQSNIARLESGNQNFTIQFLQKIITALDAELEIFIKV